MASQISALHLARREAKSQAQKANMRFSGKAPSALLYGGVGVIALLKDLLDLSFIGSLPGIGFVVTSCFTFLIWILLAVFDRSGGNTNAKMMRGLVLVAVAMVEGLGFGLNFLPVETLTILLLYRLAHSAWRKAKKESGT